MTIQRDLRGYGRNRPTIVWPNGARIAVSLVVNFEEGGERSIEDGDQENEPFGEVVSVQPPGIRDLVQEQVFDYGMRAGLWRFLDALEARRASATFMMCGRTVERVPDLARAVTDAGHEPAVHGWRWLPHSKYTDPGVEKADIIRTRETIAAATRVQPVGFMSRGGQSAWTRSLLAELGFTYDSNALNDDLPYWDVLATGQRMLVLPYGFDTNDMKFFHPNGFVEPDQFARYVGAALDVLAQEAAAGRSSMLSVGFHLRICGRPARFAAVQAILQRLAAMGDSIWIARRADIADHFRKAHPMDR
jgi:peptidoglycan/xylan/chitin deacetylase (PgdA/CDA1 family)